MDMAVRRRRASFGLTLLAVAYSIGLLIWVAAVPAFDGETLLDYGGPGSLAITVQPLLFSLLMWGLLRRRTSGSRVASATAGVLGTLYLIWSVLAVLTLAAGAFPAAVILLFAVWLTRVPTRGPPGSRSFSPPGRRSARRRRRRRASIP
jgi:hypothetical protein